MQKAIKQSVNHAKISKRALAHSFWHSFVSHLMQAKYDIRTIKELLVHSDLRTTMIYFTHKVRSITIKQAKMSALYWTAAIWKCGAKSNPSLCIRPMRKKLRAVQLLLGHTKLKNAVRSLDVEVDETLEMAEQIEV